METGTLQEKIAELPDGFKLKLEGYVDILLAESKRSNTDPKLKQPKRFGGMKGLVTYIADDFDEPLDEFKAYM